MAFGSRDDARAGKRCAVETIRTPPSTADTPINQQSIRPQAPNICVSLSRQAGEPTRLEPTRRRQIYKQPPEQKTLGRVAEDNGETGVNLPAWQWPSVKHNDQQPAAPPCLLLLKARYKPQRQNRI